MTSVVVQRIVAALVPCGLAAGVFCFASCRSARLPQPPSLTSYDLSSSVDLPGKIEGHVQDETGALVPVSEITVTSAVTGQVWTIITDRNSNYSVPNLPPGLYTVQGTRIGFKITTRSGVQVKSEETTRVDLVLQAGEMVDVKTVSEAGPSESMLPWSSPPPPPAPPLPSSFNTEEYGVIDEPGFALVATKPLSTFSIDVDTASYANLRRFLRDGRLPPADAVRIEELINYFEYDYPEPEEGEPFGIVTEIGACPWSPSHRLIHIGLRSKPVATTKLPPANLVFLLDVSGSMDSADKLPLLKKAFSLLTRQLRPQDRISVVVYAGTAEMVLPPTSGAQQAKILAAVSDLEADGSTAGGAGIRLAYYLARESFVEAGNNRVILATDGDFNVGVSSEGELVKLIERERESGIFLSVLGFGTGNLKDAKMEKLADHGNGNYSYIDSLLEARRVLVKQMGATLVTVAKDVKLQVEFNPAQAKAYRLIGYENRRLRDEEFNDDRKDAGDLGAGHSVTALYEVIPAGSDEPIPGVDPLKYQKNTLRSGEAGSHEVLTVKLRYKPPRGSKSRLLTRVLSRPGKGATPSDAFRFAAAVVEFGLCLRDSPYKGTSDYDHAFEQVRQTLGSDEEGRRSELLFLIKTAKDLTTQSAAVRTNTP